MYSTHLPIQRRAALFLAAMFGLQSPLFAQPTQWKIVVPFPAAGSNDLAARIFADALTKRLKQTVVVENKAGANGVIGAQAALSAPRDDGTLMVASDSVALLQVFQPDMKMDLLRDFSPIAVLGQQPLVVVTRPESGFKSIADVVARARGKPNSVTYATTGQGSIQHLVGELMAQQLKIDLLNVPYKGGGQAVTDTIGGQTDLAVLGAAAVLAQIQAGKLIALAVSTKQASSQFPSVRPLAEQGAAEMDVAQWSTLFAPNSASERTLTLMRSEALAILADPSIKERLVKVGFDLSNQTPQAFSANVAKERARWIQLVRERKISNN